MRSLPSKLAALGLAMMPACGAWAAETAEVAESVAVSGGGHHGLPLMAQPVAHLFGFPITNSMIVAWVAAALIILVVQLATRRMTFIPGRLQNFVEWVVESLYEFLEGLVGAGLTRQGFWFFASVFIFILATNWFGLLPFVGTVGWGEHMATGFKVTVPLLRGANADINMTLSLSVLFTVMWFVWALKAQGPVGMVKHLFGPPGGMKGFMFYLMVVIFLMIGFIEVFQIMVVRPLALTLRLYGNIYAGENLMETLLSFPYGGWISAVLGYFMELLVGLIQATVFMLLSAVFTLLMCQHEESGEPSAAH